MNRQSAPKAGSTTNVAATFRSAQDVPSSNNAAPSGWRRKGHRLQADRYVGENAYSLTFVTEDRLPHFATAANVDWCLEELARAVNAHDFEVLAYVFMPDHLHTLIVGTSQTAILSTVVKAFKQRTAFWFKQRSHQALWQKSYFDHVVRRDEDLEMVARYLASNPLHAGLAEDWQSYSYWGGPLLEALAERNGPLLHDGPPGADLKVAATSVRAGGIA